MPATWLEPAVVTFSRSNGNFPVYYVTSDANRGPRPFAIGICEATGPNLTDLQAEPDIVGFLVSRRGETIGSMTSGEQAALQTRLSDIGVAAAELTETLEEVVTRVIEEVTPYTMDQIEADLRRNWGL
jgi:hypothetical protein